MRSNDHTNAKSNWYQIAQRITDWHPEAELLLFENYSIIRSRYHPKSKEQVCRYSWDYTINNIEIEDENEK